MYEIVTEWEDPEVKTSVVHRRYNHFQWLRERLVKKYPHHAIIILPEKTVRAKMYSNDSDLIKERIR